jgi:hypothetical protein
MYNDDTIEGSMNIAENNVRRIIREELIRLMEQEEAKPKKLDDLDFKSSDRLEYERWARANGHVSPDVQDTFVSYLLDQNLTSAHDLHDRLCDEMGFNHDSVMASIAARDRSDDSSDPNDVDSIIEEIASL